MSQNLTLHFVGPQQILGRIEEVAYRIALPRPLANLHDMFHVSHLKRYIQDPSHVIQVDDAHVRDNLIVHASPMWIEDREVNQLCCKDIALIKLVQGGSVGGSMTWEHQEKIRDSYMNLFSTGILRSKFSKVGDSCNTSFCQLILLNLVKHFCVIYLLCGYGGKYP